MLHECERTLEHRVLKVVGRLEGSNLARKVLTDTEVLGPPTHPLTHPDQTCSHAGYGLFLSSFRSEQTRQLAEQTTKSRLVPLNAVFWSEGYRELV